MVKKSSWKTRGFPNEVGSIGEKIGRIWLEDKGYKVYSYQAIGMFARLKDTRLRMSRRRKKEYKENDRKTIQNLEEKLLAIFGQKYEALETFDETINQLEKTEKEKRLANEIKKKRSIGFDYIATKNNTILFIEVKANQAELRKYQKLLSKIVKEHGFNPMVLRPTVKITIGNITKLDEPEKIYEKRIAKKTESSPINKLDLHYEYDSIAYKVAKDWLLENGYKVYDFLWHILSPFTSESLSTIFGEKLEDLNEYINTIKNLLKDVEEYGYSRHRTNSGRYPNFLVKKNNLLYFVYIILNQTKPKKYVKQSNQIALEHGFRTFVLNFDVTIGIGEINLIEV